MIKATQNGNECDDGFLVSGTNKPFEDYYESVAPGATVRVSEAFVISDLSDVTLKVFEYPYEENQSQTVTIKLQ